MASQWLKKVSVLLVCTLTLTGCDYFVSQTPIISEFIQRTPESIYQQAKEAMDNARYNSAINNFNAFVVLYPEHKKIRDVYMGLMGSYVARNQFEDALKVIEDFKAKFPDQLKESLHMKEIMLEMQRQALSKKKADLELDKMLFSMSRLFSRPRYRL